VPCLNVIVWWIWWSIMVRPSLRPRVSSASRARAHTCGSRALRRECSERCRRGLTSFDARAPASGCSCCGVQGPSTATSGGGTAVIERRERAAPRPERRRLYPAFMATTYAATISLGDTDAAGVLFFARLFDFVQRAFEAHIGARGLPIARCLSEGVFAPVVHAEADYRTPLRLGDAITIESSVESIGDSSVRMAYIVRKSDGALAAEALVVHVCIGSDGRSVPVAEALREALARA